jgi:hypothetical protein
MQEKHAVPEEMVDCRGIALEVEDLLNQPLHGDDLLSAVQVGTYHERGLHDAERDNIVRLHVVLVSWTGTKFRKQMLIPEIIQSEVR